jgi:glucosamine 6-phosphate synthetase-like amidotransferase/phosphosugar isomerase protein
MFFLLVFWFVFIPSNQLVKIPSNGPLTALLAAVPLQLMAYELAVAKGMMNTKQL